MNAVAEELVRRLRDAGWTIAVAETCTGGLIGSLLTDVPGSSRVFPGGVIAYGNQPKRELLGVTPETLTANGAVSAEAAAAMAEGVRDALGTDVGIAATGISGPTGGGPEKPIGTVFIACASPDGTTTEHHVWQANSAPESVREQNKHKTALAAIDLALRALSP